MQDDTLALRLVYLANSGSSGGHGSIQILRIGNTLLVLLRRLLGRINNPLCAAKHSMVLDKVLVIPIESLVSMAPGVRESG